MLFYNKPIYTNTKHFLVFKSQVSYTEYFMVLKATKSSIIMFKQQ